MWYVFPQLRSLGRSETARFYGLEDVADAAAYLAHPLLGSRLVECTGLVLQNQGRSAHEIFGSPDDLKLCSCMTLFEQAMPAQPQFGQVIAHFFQGRRDALTLAALEKRRA